MVIREATIAAGLFVSIVPRDDDQVKDLAAGGPGSHALVITDDNTEMFVVFGNIPELDWLIRRINREASKVLREATRPEAGYILAAELDRDDALGPFATEDHRLAMADRLLIALDIRGYKVAKRPQGEPEPAPPTVFWPSTPVRLDDLDAGVIVQRHTDQEWTERGEGASTLQVDLPCCARRLEFPADGDLEVDLVCQYDRIRYTLRLAEESDGGFVACFTVEGPVTMAKPRPAKRRLR